MNLREVPDKFALRVIRDGTFRSLGFVSHERDGLLVFLGEPRYVAQLRDNARVSCVLTTEALANDVAAALPERTGLAVVANPKAAFYALHAHLARQTTFYGTPQATSIASSATVHARATIAEQDVHIGEDVVVEANVVVLPGVSIGRGSVIRAGAVIGSEGFQVMVDEQTATRVPHAGWVRIGERVDIHSNTCVDRAVFGETIIGDDTTIDNLVHVAHDVVIGARCRIVAHAMIGGSARIGDGAWIGPSAAVSSGIVVGANAWVSIGSVVTRNVASGAKVTGNFAIDHDRYLEFLRTIR